MHRVSLGDTWSRQVHPDIESERYIPSFNVERLINILDGGPQNTELRRKVGKRKLRNGTSALCPYAFLRRGALHWRSHLQMTNFALKIPLLEIYSFGL